MRVDHNECNNEIQHIFIPIAFGLLFSWFSLHGLALWEIWENAFSYLSRLSLSWRENDSWRESASRDSKPRNAYYLLTWAWLASNLVTLRQGENPSCYL